jgi:hypothetical protein
MEIGDEDGKQGSTSHMFTHGLGPLSLSRILLGPSFVLLGKGAVKSRENMA